MERERGVSAFTGEATIYTVLDEQVELHVLAQLLMQLRK